MYELCFRIFSLNEAFKHEPSNALNAEHRVKQRVKKRIGTPQKKALNTALISIYPDLKPASRVP